MATAANWRDKLRQIEASHRVLVPEWHAKTVITAKSSPANHAEARFGSFGAFGTPSGNAERPTAGNAPWSGDTGLPVSDRPDVALPLPVDSAESRLPIIPSRDNFEERAALVEYGAGVPREWAEGFARLDLASPLQGFDERRWRTLIDDGGKFLDQWGVEAARLGWSALDVFGAHPVAPAVRYDAAGLVQLISGGEVIAIRTDRATIRARLSRSELTYLMSPRAGVVALWDLLIFERRSS